MNRTFKLIIPLILAAACIPHFYSACSRSSSPGTADFERHKDDGKKKIPALKKGTLKTDSHGAPYFSRRNITFPFFTDAPGFTIKTTLTGDIGVYFAVYSETDDTLDIFEKHSGSSDTAPVKKIPLHKGINEIFFRRKMTENGCFYVESSKGRLVVSTPITYKITPPAKRKLVFLISVDTLSALHMGLYGYNGDTTPHVDEFARDSVVFTNAFCNSTWTVSSHMCLFTSLQEHKHKVTVAKDYKDHTGTNDHPSVKGKRYIFPLSPAIPFLVENLAEKFITISFNGGINMSANFGFFRGFDLYAANKNDIDDPKASQHLFEKTKTHLRNSSFPRAFYFLHTFHVHIPYNPEQSFLDRTAPGTGITSFDFQEDIGGNGNIFKDSPTGTADEVKRLYDAEILSFDSAFGDFISFLKSGGLYDNAVLILLSDHGEEFLEHGSWCHSTNLYNEQTRIPLIIKFPHQAFKGKKIESNVSLLDVLPTLMDYLDIEIPRTLHGESMMGMIEGKDGSENGSERMVVTSLFKSKPFQFLPGKAAVIYRQFKLVFNEPLTQKTRDFFSTDPPFISRYELYDLKKDGKEKDNLFTKSSQPVETRRMLKYLEGLIKQMKKSKFNAPGGEKQKMPPELKEQLKTLGYIE
jgi:arylsulfatase A-like enzyme